MLYEYSRYRQNLIPAELIMSPYSIKLHAQKLTYKLYVLVSLRLPSSIRRQVWHPGFPKTRALLARVIGKLPWVPAFRSGNKTADSQHSCSRVVDDLSTSLTELERRTLTDFTHYREINRSNPATEMAKAIDNGSSYANLADYQTNLCIEQMA